MNGPSQRVMRMALSAFDMLITESLRNHKEGAALLEMHDNGEIRWRVVYDEGHGVITFGAVLPNGKTVGIAAIQFKAPDIVVKAAPN